MTGLGYCDLDGEKFSAAVDHFKRALALSPGFGEAIIGLAEAYKLRGDRKEAVVWYQQYLDKLPNGPKALMARNNIRDLTPRGASGNGESPPAAAAPSSPPTPPPSAAAPDEPKKDEPKAEDKPVELPKLPPAPANDEPPP